MARKSRKYIAGTGDTAVRTAGKTYNTAIYARLSVEDSGKRDGGDSIEKQVYIAEQYIEEHPYLNLCGTFVDNGETGVNFNRPRFNALMDEIKAGRINCIVVKDAKVKPKTKNSELSEPPPAKSPPEIVFRGLWIIQKDSANHPALGIRRFYALAIIENMFRQKWSSNYIG